MSYTAIWGNRSTGDPIQLPHTGQEVFIYFKIDKTENVVDISKKH